LGPDEVAGAIRDAIEALPLKEREAVSLRYEQGLNDCTAADVLDVSRSTLDLRARRGLERMRVALAARGFAYTAVPLLARQVRGLGVPPMPETLKTALMDLLGNAPPPGPGWLHVRSYRAAAPERVAIDMDRGQGPGARACSRVRPFVR
jgi:hypothetical protein